MANTIADRLPLLLSKKYDSYATITVRNAQLKDVAQTVLETIGFVKRQSEAGKEREREGKALQVSKKTVDEGGAV